MRRVVLATFMLSCSMLSCSPVSSLAAQTAPSGAREPKTGEQKAVTVLKPVVPPTTGNWNYKVTMKLPNETRVGNYSVAVEDAEGAWRVTGHWPASAMIPGEMSDIQMLEKGTLLVRKDSFQRAPKPGEASKAVTADVAFAGNRVTGSSTTATGEQQPVASDLPVPPFPGGVAIDVVIGCLPLANDYAVTYRYWDVHKLSEGSLDVKVVGAERVTVPTGTFDTWKVELRLADGSETGTVWITKDTRVPVKSGGPRGTTYISTELVP